jgi:glycosyltransferase involved in cell wall biosynthesis
VSTSLNLPLVSILINNYNYAQFLEEAIDSALDQTYPHVEVVVVDDGSTDNSQRVIERYGTRIVAVCKANGGQASAFNAGFAAARGSIIMFLDADDKFLQHKVEAVVDLFHDHPAVGSVFHAQFLWRGDERLPSLGRVPEGEHDFQRRIARGGAVTIPAATSGMAFRRSILAQILPMPEAQGIGLSDNFLKFMAVGLAPTYFSGDRLGIQRIHGANLYTLRAETAEIKARIALLTAHALRDKMPAATRFADRLFATAIGRYMRRGSVPDEARPVANEYWRRATLTSKLWIVGWFPYYFLR